MLPMGLTRGVKSEYLHLGRQLANTFHLIDPSPHCHIIEIAIPIVITIVAKPSLPSTFPTQGPWSFQKPGSDVSHDTDLFCSERGVGKHGVRQKQAPEGVLCVPSIRPAGLQTA